MKTKDRSTRKRVYMMSRKRPYSYSDSDEEENPSNASCDQGSSVDEEDDPEVSIKSTVVYLNAVKINGMCLRN